MSLRTPEEVATFDGEWVNIYNPTTDGLHTCTSEAFDLYFKDRGWQLASNDQVAATLTDSSIQRITPPDPPRSAKAAEPKAPAPPAQT